MADQRLQESSGRWFCPVHYDEFWMPHAGQCPAGGCEETLEEWVPLSVAEKLATAIERYRDWEIGLGVVLDALAEFRAAYPREETTG
jgi:hypothetical protein